MKTTTMDTTKIVRLTIESFELELENCLTIISEPTKKEPYYVCNYVSDFHKSVVKISIIK